MTFKLSLKVIPAQREEHGEMAVGFVCGLGPEVAYVSVFHWLELSHMALPTCKGGWEM